MIKIIVTDNKNKVIFRFISPTIPRIGEQIQSPHQGTYTVEKVIYEVSDDRVDMNDNHFDYKDEVLYISIQARQWRYED